MLRKTGKTLLSLFTVMILLLNISIPALASEPDSSAQPGIVGSEATPAATTKQHPGSEPATPGTTNGDGSDETTAPEPEPETPAAAPATLKINSSINILRAATPGNQPAKIVADNHNLMSRVDGRLFGWGDNTYGQLGLGAGAPAKIYEPTEITFFADKGLKIKDIYVVEDASFVLCSNGELYACGKGLNGRLGLGDTANKNTWTLVPGSQTLRIEKLYCGKEFVIAATSNNELYGWGRNNYGQVGVGTKVDVLTPTLVMSNADRKYLEVGADFVLLIKQDNSAYVWGSNDGGRYGFDTGTIAPTNTALSMGACTNPAAESYSCGTTTGNPTGAYFSHTFATCAGKWSTYAQYTGIKATNQIITVNEFTSPQKVITGAGRAFNSISNLSQTWNPTGTANGVTSNINNFKSTATHTHTHNLSYCAYGGNGCRAPTSKSGATATGTATWQYVLPNAYAYFDTGELTEIQIGNKHGIATINGIPYGWGDNSLKQQGTSGNANGYMVPLTQINDYIKALESGEGFSHLIVAGDTNYIISGTGNVSVWGSNTNGKAGTGSTASYIDTPTKINGLDGKATATIVPGRGHVIVITHTGDVYTMGDNLYGQLGLGDTYADEIKVTSPELVETFKFSEVAVVPDAPDGIDTPNEVDAGTSFEINWTNVGAERYEIVRHFTPEASSLMTFAEPVPSEEVVYTGDQTTFTDTIHEEGTAYYTGRAVSFLGDYSAKATSGDIRVLAAADIGGDNNNGNNNNGDNNNGNNNNNNNGGGGLTNDQFLQLLAILKSSGYDDETIAALIASSRRTSSGDVNVTVPDSGMDNKALAALIAALAGNNGDGSSQTVPGTNVYNPGMSGQELAELIRYIGINELEPVTGNSLDAIETALKVADFILSHSSAQPANNGAASITAPPVYQAAQSPVPKYLNLYLIIGLIVTIISFIIVRVIPEAREAKDNADT